MTDEYEYHVEHDNGSGTKPDCYTKDPKYAGEVFRRARKSILSGDNGGTVELYRRKLGPRELVEKFEAPAKDGNETPQGTFCRGDPGKES